jgi:hypothetical protein
MIRQAVPADMCEKEAAINVQGVLNRLGELVVNSMDLTPIVDRGLASHGVEKDQNVLQSSVGFKAAMTPQTMDADSHRQVAQRSQKEKIDERLQLNLQRDEIIQAHKKSSVNKNVHSNISPLNACLVGHFLVALILEFRDTNGV